MSAPTQTRPTEHGEGAGEKKKHFVVPAPRVFYPALGIILVVVVIAIGFPVRTGATLATLQGWVVAGLGPYYVILVACLLYTLTLPTIYSV